MSGDVQARQRRKDKKKQKRDEPTTLPGIDTSKLNESEKKSVQMHIQEHDHDHGAGVCAKVVFFVLMAILLTLIGLIVIENRGNSDVDTPLSESRFSEYLQGWVDEKREEEHHDEPHFHEPEHDDEEEEHSIDEHSESHQAIPEDEPYPEEKDVSNPDEIDEQESQELNAELNTEESDQNEPDEEGPDSQQNDDDDEEEEGNQSPENENNSNDDLPNLFEDSAPFDEEDDDDEPQSENLENVIDNDEGEELLLQKLAEESEMAQQEPEESEQEEGSSPLMFKLGVGVLLAIVAHQIIIKKISATNRSNEESDIVVKSNEDLLNKRRFTMLSNSDERLINEDMDNEEIIEVMMVATPNLDGDDEGEYSDEELGEEEEEIEEYSDEFEPEFETSQVPHTFEDFNKMYKSQAEETTQEPRRTSKVTFIEPQSVDQEIETEVEQQIFKMPESSQNIRESSPQLSPDELEDYGPEIDIDMGEEELEEEEEEEEEPSGEELIDEDDIDYEESDENLSDIDDSELLKRLEAKYGKIDDDKADTEEHDDASWTKIPSEGGAQSYMDELLKQQTLEENPIVKELYEKAKALDTQAEKERSNKRLLEAIQSYKELIESHGDKLNDTIMKEVGERCIERMRFIGRFKQVIDVHYKLIHRFIDDPSYRNQLAVTYLLANRLSAAKLVLHEVLSEWRNNGFALVHYGFILKNLDQDYANAVIYLREGIESNEPGTQDGRFYFNLGDALQRLGRNEEANEVYKKGAEIGLFLSQYQRSLYNVDRLKSKPFWTKVETTYKDELMEILKYWQIIRDEGMKLLSQDGLFINEQENLKDVGDWKQFELYSRGVKTKRCQLAPITCKVIENFKAAATCKRGQVKFSVLHPNTHVHSHCGPTNCRIRAHLGLTVPENTFLRVADEVRSWKEGEWLIFDDSFEHEVWHNGTSVRLVLIVDVWHPDLTEDEKLEMSPI